LFAGPTEVLRDIEHVRRIQRVALGVQRVARVLDEPNVIAIEEGDVVEATVRLVAVVAQAQLAGVRRR
jgi:hypothetical protein